MRALVVAVTLALVALVVAPAGPAHAARPKLTIFFTSADTGIVAGNPIWGQKSIQWTAYAAHRPKGSSLVTQVKVGGSWRTIPTTGKKVRKGVATGRYYPVLGSALYRVALLSRSGKVLTKTRTWRSTGFATVPLSRVVTTLPPSIGPVTRTIGGYAYPMLWKIDQAAPGPATTATRVVVDEGRCRTLRLATSLTFTGGGRHTGTAWFSVGWSPKANLVVLGDPKASVSVTDGEGSKAETVTSLGGYGLTPSAVAYEGIPQMPGTWSGEAYYGGVGLCSRVAR